MCIKQYIQANIPTFLKINFYVKVLVKNCEKWFRLENFFHEAMYLEANLTETQYTDLLITL